MAESPDRKTIGDACGRIYGGQEPRHWGTLISWRLGGPDPLDGVSCYDAGDHWHWVSHGLSAVHDSGIELTFRVARKPGETQPPMWPIATMQGLARHVASTKRAFEAGDHLDLEPTSRPDAEPVIEALLFADDAELFGAETDDGPLRFVQAFGLTRDELAALRDWQALPFIALLRERNPRLVTDLARRSHRADPAFERGVQRGIDRDGSSSVKAFADAVGWSRDGRGGVRLAVSAGAVPEIVRALRGRCPFGRAFALHGPDETIVFWPDGVERREDEMGDDAVYVDLTPELAGVIRGTFEDDRTRQRPAGAHTWAELPGLTLVIEPTELHDADGNVVRVVG